MVVFNPHSVELLKTTPSSSSPSSLLNRLSQIQKHHKDPPGDFPRQEAATLNQNRSSFGSNDDCDASCSRQSKNILEQQARLFFKLANVSDRRESRYNVHGNRTSFHGQKHKLHNNVFAGSEVIDAMVASGLVSSREKALTLGNRLSTELNLFSRVNPRSYYGNSTLPKGRARANVLAAQTILLGFIDDSEANRPDAIGHLATLDGTAPKSGFIDDTNAFYRFGPGVLTILRGIDDAHESHLSGNDEGKSNKTATARTIATSEESTFVSKERNRQTKKKKSGKKKYEYHQVKRNLSITPNAPGCGGKIVLEDLFLQRRPEMEAQAKASANATSELTSTKVLQRGKVPKDSSKKKTKKPSMSTNQATDSIPSPYPKSILKNGGSASIRDKKKKSASTKVTKSKTKGGHKKISHKIKAGAKIKYISEKEQRIASIEKRMSVYHSEKQIASYRNMLKELKNKLSRLYTGDHIEIISLSSHSSFPPSPSKHREISTSASHFVNSAEKTLAIDSRSEGSGGDDVCGKNDTFDTALESLDDIISNNADLLAVGDDNASVWTEFIMGASRQITETNANMDTRANSDSNYANSNTKNESARNETGSYRIAAKASKENSKKTPHTAKTVHNDELQKRDVPKQHFQLQQKKKFHSPASWQAPAPLESTNESCGKEPSTVNLHGNEIDLSSWAMINRDREAEPIETGDWVKDSDFLNQTLHSHSECEIESSAFSLENSVDSRLFYGGTEDELSSIVPDDLSLFLKHQQKKEFQSHRRNDKADNWISKRQGGIDKSSFHHQDQESNNIGSTPETSGTNKNANSSSIGSFQSNATKDSNDLAKLRLVPHHRKGVSQTNISILPENQEVFDGKKVRSRDHNLIGINGAKLDDSILELKPPIPPTKVDCDVSNASEETSSGIMEAIEKDPFYQQAAEATASNNFSPMLGEIDGTNGTSSSPSLSEPGSFTASYNDSHLQGSFDDFDGDEITIETYSDEGSYMELTVGEEEIEEEIIEEGVIEEDEELYEEITVVSKSNDVHNYNQSSETIDTRPALSPRRKAAQFRSGMYLPSVPELGPEPEPEPEPQPTSPRRENSVYVEVHSMSEDDEMTQITMDCFLGSSYRSNRSLHIIPEDDYTINNGDYSNHNSYLFPLNESKEVKSRNNTMVSPIRSRNSRNLKMSSQLVSSARATRQKNLFSVQQNLKQRTKYIVPSSPLGTPCNDVFPTETSQQRIQEILWKDLPSSDVTVTWSALEELRILVANESRSRAYLVRHGGVMVIIDTMAEQLEVEVIQFLCCNILEQLAMLDFEVGLTILELGGVSLIEQSMKKHTNSRRVNEMGDTALRTLLRNS